MADKYKWGVVDVLPDGHRIFPTGDPKKIALADDSGREPQDTDDGILWLNIDGAMLTVDSEKGHEFFFIPVISNDGRHHKTISNAATLLYLAKLYDWPIYDHPNRQTYKVTTH